MGERTFIRHKKDQKDEFYPIWVNDEKTRSEFDWKPWNYMTEDGNENPNGIPTTKEEASKWSYAKGYDQLGNPYHVEFPNVYSVNDLLYQTFSIYPTDEDGYYTNRFGRAKIAPWSDLYDPNSTVLNELVVYPKTAELLLKTYDYLDSNYPISHSEMYLEPLYPNGPSGYISKGTGAKDYNLFKNNCADGTCSIAEIATNKKAKRRLITTPAWVKKFLKENGGSEYKDGLVHLKLNEDTALKVEQAMKELNKKWGYE